MPTYAQLEQTNRDWPPEAFLDGPVPDGEDLLQRTMTKVHKHSARSARIRAAVFTSAVVLACAVLAGTGVVIGRMLESPASAVTATDPRTDAHLVALMTPTDDGTSMEITVTGLPVGTACHLTFVGKDGTRMSDGTSWRIPLDAADHPIETHVWMPESSLAEIDVTTSTGVHLIAHMPG